YYIDRYRVQTPVKELGNSDEAAVDFDSEYSNEPTSSYLEESNPNEELSSLQKGNPSGAQGQ
ncbi:MAG TPA: hypothetical protein DF383_04845, partial [Deltaproteobacteria bacterium]|nr:hypothetical protein [Deltaproteobacteria bacterium]